MKKKKIRPPIRAAFPPPGKIYLQLIKIANYYFSKKKKKFQKKFSHECIAFDIFPNAIKLPGSKRKFKKKIFRDNRSRLTLFPLFTL